MSELDKAIAEHQASELKRQAARAELARLIERYGRFHNHAYFFVPDNETTALIGEFRSKVSRWSTGEFFESPLRAPDSLPSLVWFDKDVSLFQRQQRRRERELARPELAAVGLGDGTNIYVLRDGRCATTHPQRTISKGEFLRAASRYPFT